MNRYCRVRLFDRIKERQAEKTRQNVEKRKMELMQQNKLPEGVKNMLQRLRAQSKVLEEKRLSRLNELSFQPAKAKPVPNFAEMH